MPSARLVSLLLIALSAVASLVYLDLSPGDLIPDPAHMRTARRFFAAALSPALTYETPPSVEAPPLPLKVARAALTTLVFALASVGLSLIAGLPLGIVASAAWWRSDAATPATRAGYQVLRGLTRAAIGAMRSTHELIWAVLFLCAFGLTPLAAAIAIAIPYAGTLAKVFSELLDEAPDDAARALTDMGARPSHVFCVGLLPRAMPDMIAYTLYRFECALRASAVLGFFGIATFGYYISLSFENLQFREVWSYLYALFAMVLVVDWWSGAVRRRIVG